MELKGEDSDLERRFLRRGMDLLAICDLEGFL